MDEHDRLPAASGEPIRMLSALESTPRPKGRRWRAAPEGRNGTRVWMAVLMLAIVATGGAYVWLLTHAEKPPLAQASEAERPAPVRTARASVPTEPATPETAPIESVPPLLATAASTPAPDAPGSAPTNPFDGLKAPVMATASSSTPASTGAAGPFATLAAPGAGTRKTPPAAAPADPAPSSVPLKWSHALSAPAARAGSAPDTKASADRAPAEVESPRLSAAERRRAQRDADAALLAALVSHVDTHSRREVNGEMAPLRLPGASSSPLTTIAQIVNHCRSLHGEEAKVCRVRICEHYWGKDDACSIKPTFAAHEPH